MRTKRLFLGLAMMLAGVVFGDPESGELGMPAADLRDRADLALAVYRPWSVYPSGWERIRFQQDPDGFQAAVYQRSNADGTRDVIIAFAGTNDWDDVRNDIRQGSFISANALLGPVDQIAESQYERAQAFAAGYVHMAKADPAIRRVELVGHSMAGAFVQVLSGRLDLPATAFNAAALAKMNQRMTPLERDRAARNTRQYVHANDFVFHPTRIMPTAVQYGTVHSITPSRHPGFGQGHSMESLIEALKDTKSRYRVILQPHERLQGVAAIRERIGDPDEVGGEAARRVLLDTTLENVRAMNDMVGGGGRAMEMYGAGFTNSLAAVEAVDQFRRTLETHGASTQTISPLPGDLTGPGTSHRGWRSRERFGTLLSFAGWMVGTGTQEFSGVDRQGRAWVTRVETRQTGPRSHELAWEHATSEVNRYGSCETRTRVVNPGNPFEAWVFHRYPANLYEPGVTEIHRETTRHESYRVVNGVHQPVADPPAVDHGTQPASPEPVKGVNMEMAPGEKDFRPSGSERLRRIRESALRARNDQQH